MIEASDDVATRELARELGLKAGAALVRIEAIRLADRTPICVSTSWLVGGTVSGAGRVFAAYALDDEAARALRRSATIAGQRPKSPPAMVDATDAARLDLPLGQPMLVVDCDGPRSRRQAAGDEALAVRRGAGGVSGGERVSGATLLSP